MEGNEKRAKVESSTERKRRMKEKKENPEVQKRTVFLNNVSFNATEEQIREYFGKFGTITEVTIVCNNHGKPRGFAYVEFSKEEEAKLQECADEIRKKLDDADLAIVVLTGLP